jgi:hypothetical protein
MVVSGHPQGRAGTLAKAASGYRDGGIRQELVAGVNLK